MLSYIFQVIIWGFLYVAHATTTISQTSSLGSKLSGKISILRENGRLHHTRKRFGDASKCYEAALQLIEGIPGDEAYELRRRCGLNLAYCYLKESKLGDAVARCSEVIDESSNFLDESGQISSFDDEQSQLLRDALATAHKRRSVALQLLGRHELAKVDNSISKGYKSRNIKSARKTVLDVPLRLDALQDFVEECQVKYPRKHLSAREIERLCQLERPRSTNLQHGGFPAFGPASDAQRSFRLSSLVKQFGPMLGLSDRAISFISTSLDLYSRITSVVGKGVAFMQKRREFLVMTLTLVWIFSYVLTNERDSMIAFGSLRSFVPFK